MAVTFDGNNKLIICAAGTISLEVKWLYSRWKEWVATNPQFPQAFTTIGGEPIGSGLYAGSLYFLVNGWRIRPQEANHTLTILGNLFGEDGQDIIASTLGGHTVVVNRLVSNLAQGIATSGSSGLTGSQESKLNAIHALITGDHHTLLDELHKLMGLKPGTPLVVSPTSRTAGTIQQTIQDDNGTVTVSRV